MPREPSSTSKRQATYVRPAYLMTSAAHSPPMVRSIDRADSPLAHFGSPHSRAVRAPPPLAAAPAPRSPSPTHRTRRHGGGGGSSADDVAAAAHGVQVALEADLAVARGNERCLQGLLQQRRDAISRLELANTSLEKRLAAAQVRLRALESQRLATTGRTGAAATADAPRAGDLAAAAGHIDAAARFAEQLQERDERIVQLQRLLALTRLRAAEQDDYDTGEGEEEEGVEAEEEGDEAVGEAPENAEEESAPLAAAEGAQSEENRDTTTAKTTAVGGGGGGGESSKRVRAATTFVARSDAHGHDGEDDTGGDRVRAGLQRKGSNSSSSRRLSVRPGAPSVAALGVEEQLAVLGEEDAAAAAALVAMVRRKYAELREEFARLEGGNGSTGVGDDGGALLPPS